MLKAQGLYGVINGKFRKVLKNAASQYTAEDNATDNESNDIITEVMVLDAKTSTLIMGFCSQGQSYNQR